MASHSMVFYGNQLGAMMVSDDAYAGSESFYKLAAAVKDVLGFDYTMPVHQGRAAEHLLAKVFVKPGDAVLMNYHFTTTRAHFELAGATVVELYGKETLNTQSTGPFKGNLDLQRFADAIQQYGVADTAARPVLFIFNGNPLTASLCLHI